MSDPTLTPGQVLLLGDITAQLAAAPSAPQLRARAPILAQVAVEIRGDERARRLAQLMTCVDWRESQGGAALRPPGPAGYGDFARRQWPARRFAQFPDLCTQGDKVLDENGDQHTNAAGEPLWWTLLRPGKGFGFGESQLDAQAHHDLVTRVLANGEPAWTDPLEHHRMSMRILADGMDAFPGDEAGGIDSFNAGIVNVQRAEAAPGHQPDRATTGLNYGSDVLDHAKRWFGA